MRRLSRNSSPIIYSTQNPRIRMTKRFRLKPGSQLLLFLIFFTFGVWVLRGLTFLSFLPGIVLYFLMLSCIAVFVVNSIRSMR